MSAQQTLAKQFKEISKNPIPGFIVNLVDDNMFEWSIGIIGPPKTMYEGGYFLATIKFPNDYPFMPPKFIFNDPFFHPNVYSDGSLCISILHPPGDDPMSGEKAFERWNPTQSVESILFSIVSLLNDPNCSSPANVDAGVMYRNDRANYIKKIKEQVEHSKKSIPLNLILPTTEQEFMVKPPTEEVVEDHDFWYDDDDDDGDEDEEELMMDSDGEEDEEDYEDDA